MSVALSIFQRPRRLIGERGMPPGFSVQTTTTSELERAKERGREGGREKDYFGGLGMWGHYLDV